jgi:uncharacterized protein
MLRVGLISDTHNLLRPEAKSWAAGCDFIVHAGDICNAGIIRDLEELAQVTAVRGNNDKGAWADGLRDTELLKVDDVLIYVIHDLAKMRPDTIAPGVQVVVSGHSHKPAITMRGKVLFINPGSAGPRRFKLPISVAELEIEGRSFSSRLVDLEKGPQS